jgi:RNA polymerase sigma factor (sigma-70 family)
MTPLLSAPLLRTQSDGRLASLAARGHDRAFEAIVERYRRPLQRYLRRVLSEALAEDVLQATFVRAWQALRAGTEVRDLRPWLYRIAHNQALNALRAAAPPLSEGAQALPATSIESEFERREELRHTLEGIESLPERQRAALVAVAVADRPHADVAAELGLSDGALRQLLLRARTALRAAATALTPYPLVSWLAAGQDTGAARVAEVAAGAGGAGLAVKAGAAVLAASAVVASGPVLRERHASEPRAAASGAQARHAAPSPATTPSATAVPNLGVSEPIVRRAPAASGGEGEGRDGDAKAAAKHHHGSSGSASRGPGSAEEQEAASGSGEGSDGDKGTTGSGGGSDDSGPGDSSGRHTSSKRGSDDGREGSGSGGDDGAVVTTTLQPVAPDVAPETESGGDGSGSGSSGSDSSGSGSGTDGSGDGRSGGD